MISHADVSITAASNTGFSQRLWAGTGAPVARAEEGIPSQRLSERKRRRLGVNHVVENSAKVESCLGARVPLLRMLVESGRIGRGKTGGFSGDGRADKIRADPGLQVQRHGKLPWNPLRESASQRLAFRVSCSPDAMEGCLEHDTPLARLPTAVQAPGFHVPDGAIRGLPLPQCVRPRQNAAAGRLARVHLHPWGILHRRGWWLRGLQRQAIREAGRRAC